jgi:hypothetical protein
MFGTLFAGFDPATFGLLVAALLGLNLLAYGVAVAESIPVRSGAYEGLGLVVNVLWVAVAYAVGASLVTAGAAFFAVSGIAVLISLGR